jgi:hypothetical protein
MSELEAQKIVSYAKAQKYPSGGISYGLIGEDQTVSDFSGTHLYMIHESFYDTFLSIPKQVI